MAPEVEDGGNKRVLKFNCKSCEHGTSIARSPACMREVIQQLETHASVDKILLEGEYVQEYQDQDLALLKEFVRALENSRYLILKRLSPGDCKDCEEKRRTRADEIWNKLKEEPKKGQAKLKQLKKELEEKSKRGAEICKSCRKIFSIEE